MIFYSTRTQWPCLSLELFNGGICRIRTRELGELQRSYDISKRHSHTLRKVLTKAIYCKALCDVKFRHIEGNGRKFCHIELSIRFHQINFLTVHQLAPVHWDDPHPNKGCDGGGEDWAALHQDGQQRAGQNSKVSCTQVHTVTNRYTQVHAGTPRYTQLHPDTPRYTQVHAVIPRYTQVHVGTRRYTQVRSGTCRYMHVHAGTLYKI